MNLTNWKKSILKKTSVGNLLALLLSIASYSQSDLPKVVPPSPEASALFRFQDYPMDYSTGLPSISIPLYEVKSGSLSVPISISYHASGRRVSDQDGPIALGWSLNAGGMISRTVYGDPDFGTPTNGTYYFPYPFRTTGLSNVNDYVYFEKIMHYNNPDAGILPWMESEYDIFSYNFGNNSGKFIFKDNNNVKTPVLLPTKPYIITPYYTFQGLTAIDIVDDRGSLYKFTQPEESGPDADYAVTGLLITQIISADKTDTISFQYTGFAQWNSGFSQTRTYIDSYTFNDSSPSEVGTTENFENASSGTYQIKRLTQITFKQGKVLFNLVAGSDKIDNIQIKDITNQVIKTIQFSRSQLDVLKQGGSSQNPLTNQVNNKLNTVVFKDKTGTAVENYSLEYFPTKFFAPETTVDAHYCDWWGYYNASGKLNMIPNYTIGGGVNVGGTDFNREPDLEAAKSGVLKKITFPTGGTTEFAYELNRYADPNYAPGKNGPGLRVSQITTTDLNLNSIIKTYKYGVGEVGYGFLDLKPAFENMARHDVFLYYNINNYAPIRGGTYGQYTFNSGFNSSLSALGSRPIIYTEVTEYKGTPTNNTGKTVYTYDNYAWTPSGMTAFGIQLVTKMHVYNWNYWNTPSLLKKSDYKSSNSDQYGGPLTYTLKKEAINNYTITNTDDIIGLHVQRLETYPQTSIDFAHNYYIEKNAAILQAATIYTFNDYHIPVGTKDLTSTTEKIYADDNTSISSVTNYTYNNKQLLSQTKKTESDGSFTTTDIKYPFDYTGNAVLTQMSGASLNMLNYPVEQIESNVNGATTTPLKSVRTNYYNWGTTPARIYPQTVDVKKGTNAYETRLRYLSYDNNGNPLNVSKELDTKIAYIWDYNKELPIAEVTNTTSSEIAYTSFEADGTGNWIGVTGANIVSNTTGITGTKYYTLNTTGLSIAGLSTTKKYTVTYWSRNGAYAVSGTSDAGYPKNVRTVTLNGISWTLWEHRVGNTATITVTGTGAIDELRLCPADAQMTTYTFIPLVGMSTKNEPNNRIVYYEYDAFGRLKLIKDMNGQVLKTMDYKYRSSTP